MAEAYIIVDRIDFGIRSMKTITSVEVGGYGVTSVSVGYYDGTEYIWKERPATKGIAVINITGVDFMIRVNFSNHETAKLDYINVRYKYTDKRIIRGGYGQATQVSTISDQ